MAEERPYQPSARQLSEARERGEVPVSQDLTRAAALLGALLALRLGGEGMLQALERGFRLAFAAAGRDETKLAPLLQDIAAQEAWAFGPLLLLALLGAVGAGLLQAGPLFAARAVAPAPARIDPRSSFRRLFSEEGAYELLKVSAKLAAVAVIACYTLRGASRGLVSLMERDARTSLGLGAGLVFDLCIRIAAAFVLIGVLDLFYQRYRHRSRLKMTRLQYERERRETEGDPLVRREQRLLRRRMAGGAPARDARPEAGEKTGARRPPGPRESAR